MDYDNDDGYLDKDNKRRFLYAGIVILLMLLIMGLCAFAATAHGDLYEDWEIFYNELKDYTPEYSSLDDPNLIACMYEAADSLEEIADRLKEIDESEPEFGCFIDSIGLRN